jgi:hypothetical protein
MGLASHEGGKKYERIYEVKNRTSFEELCRGYPIEFVRYFEAVRSLKFSEKPPYAQYRALFRELFIRQGYRFDYRYEWTKDPPPVPPRPVPTVGLPEEEASQLAVKCEIQKPGEVVFPIPVPVIKTTRQYEPKERTRVTIKVNEKPGATKKLPRSTSRATVLSGELSKWLEDPIKLSSRRSRLAAHELARNAVLPAWMTQNPTTRTHRIRQVR